MNKAQKEMLARIYDEIDVDINYDVENVGLPSDIDEMMELLQERIYENEVIYYHKAMDYLKEHDASLNESLGLAHDMGYTADQINSELLATLLTQQNQSEALQELRDEIEKVFYSDNN